MAPFFSIIIPVKDRCDFRLKNALKSLRNQTISPIYYEIILVDYCSNNSDYTFICNKYEVNFIRIDGNGKFHDARARNVGIKQSNGIFIISTNADILFPSSFLSVLMDYTQSYPESFFLWKRYDVNSTDDPSKTYQNWLAIATPHNDSAQGDCQVFSKRWAEQVGGFDEDYIGWGRVDIDLTERARLSGLSVLWVNSSIPLLHQNHPISIEARHYDNLRNSAIFYYKYNIIVRNNNVKWGEFTKLYVKKTNKDPFDDYRNGLICENNNDIDTAIGWYKKSISKLPDFFECHCRMAKILLNQGDISGLDNFINQIFNILKTKANPHEYTLFSRINFEKAVYHKNKKEYNEAISNFKIALEFSNNDHFCASIYLLLGITLNWKGEYSDAIEIFNHILSNFCGLYVTEANYHKAISFRGLKDYKQALSILNKVVTTSELHFLIQNLRARTADDLRATIRQNR